MSHARLTPTELLMQAREMRHEPAPAEQKLWQCLRDRQLGNFKFRQQAPLPPYIADFYCAEIQLVIELDGDSMLNERNTMPAEPSNWFVTATM